MQDDVQRIFRGLADPIRRSILQKLRQHPHSIADLADDFDVSRNAVVKHLKILEESELVVCRAIGRRKINALNPVSMKRAYDWLSHFEDFWDDKLLALKAAAEERGDD